MGIQTERKNQDKRSLRHIPVLLKEVIKFLAVKPNKLYIDTTVGGGGHSEAIIKKRGRVLGIDMDPKALEMARKRLASACPPGAFALAHGNFANLAEIAKKEGFKPVSGILFDLGISTYQLEDPSRGFSFGAEAPLDMRMDPNLKVTAKDLINVLNEGELYELFTKLGEEHYSRPIARAICRARRIKPIETCNQLVQIILRARPKRGQYDRTHPATRVFQALRIAVNDELNNLKEALPQAVDLLEPGGRLVVLSFHSLEDRIVKNFFKEGSEKGTLKILTKKPIRPTREEVEKNPRARSGKLRAAEKNK